MVFGAGMLFYFVVNPVLKGWFPDEDQKWLLIMTQLLWFVISFFIWYKLFMPMFGNRYPDFPD